MPRPVALSYNYLTDISILDEFKNGRFTVSVSEKTFHLNIAATNKEDTGIYYCGTGFLNQLEFISGTYLILKGTESKDLNIEQQPALLPVSQGDNVKIQCKILIESCAEDHSVYWFRHGATDSHPAILYTHSGGHDQCKRSSEADSKTHRCVYDFSKRNISLSDDVGIYYCAIAACGEIMFGNGTTLKNTDNKNEHIWDPLLLFLISSNVVFLIVTVTLLVDLCKNGRKRNGGSTKSESQSCEIGDSGILNYAAVSFVPVPSSSRRSRASNNREMAEYSKVHYKPRDHKP
ncbi:uncharacterized protein LOC127650651 [Xyrauchen texanus]|uniref:uncharacterized protein LOC127650651 n=1 Tax=Xyrauchen texanus TaxID=154827 RepID=UPI00224264D2|nr:uncharacterized protein LOC127650651 [Xyrauchen texanus]